MNLNYLRGRDLSYGEYWYFRLEFTKYGRLKTETIITPRKCIVGYYEGVGESFWEMYEPETGYFIFREHELVSPNPSFYLAETKEKAIDLWNEVLQWWTECKTLEIEFLRSKRL